MHSLARIVSSCWHFSWFVAVLPALMASQNLKTSNCNSQNFQTFCGKAENSQNSSEQDHSLVMTMMEVANAYWDSCLRVVSVFWLRPSPWLEFLLRFYSTDHQQHDNPVIFIIASSSSDYQIIRNYRWNIFVPDEDDSFWTTPHFSLCPKQKWLHHSLSAQDASQHKRWQQLWQYYCCH